MNVLAPSTQILDDLDQKSLPVRIEYCGRICYKSEDRIDEQSAIPFVQKMAEHGHNSVLEMGAVSFLVSGATSQQVEAFFLCQPKYLQVDRLEEDTLLISGTVRGLKEMFVFYPENPLVQALTRQLADAHPYFYLKPGLVPLTIEHPANIRIQRMSLEKVEQLPPKLMAKHRYLAVKFIVNRAVTHELVRHRPCSFLQESQRYCRYSADKFGNEVTFIKPLFYDENSEEYALWVRAMEETEKIYLELLKTSTPQAARTVLPNSCKTEIIVYTTLEHWQHICALRTPANADPSMREVMIPLQEELALRYPNLFTTLQA
ncbi:FAD-dependent thymidylate synthase [Desulfogranum japonicum]|uniref:FAD-dependent thymidylate synthase n=1 Tax=Desulfogranum japonicum TaxID=231447 RepID=UPI00041B24B1|nr:FAD-dependent thymidylate synthase [Desulfogranum japonicum]